MAITLCRRHIHLRRLDDLTRLRVAAFQGAHLYLGADFAALAPQIPSYREESPQATLNRLLLSGRADVAISDVNIFQQLSNELRHELDISPTLCPYALFTPTHYRLAFRNAQDRDRFNRGLCRFAADGGYENWPSATNCPPDAGVPGSSPKNLFKVCCVREASHGEYQLKMLMYHSYILLFRSSFLALARETLNRFLTAGWHVPGQPKDRRLPWIKPAGQTPVLA